MGCEEEARTGAVLQRPGGSCPGTGIILPSKSVIMSAITSCVMLFFKYCSISDRVISSFVMRHHQVSHTIPSVLSGFPSGEFLHLVLLVLFELT